MTDTELSELGKAALEYAQKGWKIFPLAPRNKTPITTKGLWDASCDEEVVRAWWTRTPDANIGLRTGDGGLYVLDVDGEQGEYSLALLEEENGKPLPPTRTCLTGRGRHLYFTYRGANPLGNTADRLGLKLDTRGTGGYVILPPSIHPNGGVYQWDREGHEARLPKWISQLVERKKPAFEFVLQDPTKKVEIAYEFEGGMHRYVASYFHRKLNALANQSLGGRNARLNDLAFEAGRIVQGGLAEGFAMETLIKDAARLSGLSESEINKTWESGYGGGWLAAPFVLSDDGEEAPSGFGKGGEPRKPEPGRLIVRKLSTVVPDEVKFMWGNRLVRSGVNLLAGDGGLGKSTIALQIIRSITDGVRLPDDLGQEVRGKALLVTYEDPEVVIQTHCRAMGVDMEKLYVVAGKLNELDQEESFTPRMVEDLIALVTDETEYHDVELLVIDPWGRYLDDDDNKEKLIRRAIAPLERLAQKRNMTVLILGHTNKNANYSAAVHRISGHSSLKNVVRSVIMVGNVKDQTNAIVHVKHNWSRESPAVTYAWDKAKSWDKNEVPMTWGEVTELDADELFAERKVTLREKAASWLRRNLLGNPMTMDEIKELWSEEEKDTFAWSTVEAASRDLGLRKLTEGNQYSGKQSRWALPSRSNEDTPSSSDPFAPETTVTQEAEAEDEQRDFVPAPTPIPFEPRRVGEDRSALQRHAAGIDTDGYEFF